ncbi:MAG TPA: DUF58 domain-containing protein [Candidatus Thermoplasmatota archaeon]|nr:DUF58 domain-containing protein [Candidatus Thermoplasmatota archaeon]
MSATRLGTLVLSAAWALFTVALLLGNWGMGLACFAVLGVLASTRRKALPPRSEVRREVTGDARQGSVLTVTLRGSAPTVGQMDVEAPLPLGMQLLHARRTVRRGSFELEQRVQALAVGGVPWPRVRLSMTDPWGLQEAVLEVDCPRPVVVQPDAQWALKGRRLGLRHPVTKTVKAPMASERSLEIERVRGFQAGDSMRDIDWKASSRLGGMQVRERERHMPRPVTVILDATPPMRVQRHDSKLVSAVRVARGALAAAAGAGTSSRLVALGEDGCQGFPINGVLDAESKLAALLSQGPPLAPRESRAVPVAASQVLAAVGKSAGLQVLLVDAETDPTLALELIPHLKRRGEVCVVVPATAAHLYRRHEARGPVLAAMRRWRANRGRVEEAARRLRVPCFVMLPGDEDEVLEHFARLLA